MFKSDGTDKAVADHSSGAQLRFDQRNGSVYAYKLETPAEPGFLYVRVDDPSEGRLVVDSVIRSDGKRLRRPNAWSSRAAPRTFTLYRPVAGDS